MISFSVQASNLQTLKEALKSTCPRIRFGSEFCMYDLPTGKTLTKAANLASDEGKAFTYVTPRVSDNALNKLIQHFKTLDNLGEIEIVVNDLGTLDTLEGFPNLKPHLGRQLVYIPARCPWPQITEHPVSIFVRHKVRQIFYRTALNYQPTIQLYKEMGVNSADVDWIPQSFKHYKELIRNGIRLSVHSYLIPVTVTRRCHTAKFLSESDPARCSRPCLGRTFKLRQGTVGVEFFLNGNAVFRYVKPEPSDLKNLEKLDRIEVVVAVGSLQEAVTRNGLEETIRTLREGA